jgi:hypothetical protein
MPRETKLMKFEREAIKELFVLKRSGKIHPNTLRANESKLARATTINQMKRIMEKVYKKIEEKRKEEEKYKQFVYTGLDIMKYANANNNKYYSFENETDHPLYIDIELFLFYNGFVNDKFLVQLRGEKTTYNADEYELSGDDDEIKIYTPIVSKVKSNFYIDTPLKKKDFMDYMEKGGIYYKFFVGSDNPLLRRDIKMYIRRVKPVKPNKKIQKFKDSVNEHCFLSPIIQWAENKIESSKNKSTKRNYTTIINKINKKWFPRFADGFDEQYINDFVNDLNINISVDFPFGKQDFKLLNYFSDQRAIKHFKFINTRFNHVELNKPIQQNNNFQLGLELIKSIVDRKKEDNFNTTMKKGLDIITNSIKYDKTVLNDIMRRVNKRIDLNETVVDSSNMFKSIEIETNKEMRYILNKLEEENTFNQYSEFNNIIYYIKTASNVYTLKSKSNDIINKFNLDNNIHSYTYDFIKDQKLCEFIKAGVHYNTCSQFIDKSLEGTYKKESFREIFNNVLEDLKIRVKYLFDPNKYKNFNEEQVYQVKNLDQEKAYTQFKLCPEYSGFLGKITDFRQCVSVDFAIKNNGLYQITNIVLSNKIKQINDTMKIFVNNNVYPTPDLKFLLNNGCSFDVLCGCWGSSFELEFNEDMLTKDENGVSLYAKWTGQCDNVTEYTSFQMKGQKELFENLKFHNPELKIFMVDDRATIQYKKNKVNYKGHITSFITSYQRINMLYQLLNMDLTKVIRIVTDGIYYYDHQFTINKSFRNKNDFHLSNAFINCGSGSFLSNIDEEIKIFECDKFLDHYMTSLYLGPGGCGKTHINLIDKGFNRVLYVGPSWKLSTNKKNEYSIDTSVLARLVCDSEESRFFRRTKDVFIFDECSQFTEDTKKAILKLFKDIKIVFCGDIGYQLPPVSGRVMDTTGFEFIKEFTEVFRFDCFELATLCKDLRKRIKFINQCNIQQIKNIESKKIIDFVLSSIPEENKITIDEVNKYYTIDDYILVSKNKCNKHHKFECNCDKKNYSLQYTELLKDCGNKFIVKKNTKDFNNGDIVFNDVGHCLPCHAFSIHSIQGETIKNKIFIDIRNMFEPQMLYTAISRAKNINQLYFIVSKEKNVF